MTKAALSLLVALAAGAAQAQSTESDVPLQAVQAAAEPQVFLPAGTEIPLKMTQTITIKGDSWKEGDQFNLVVASDKVRRRRLRGRDAVRRAADHPDPAACRRTHSSFGHHSLQKGRTARQHSTRIVRGRTVALLVAAHGL